MDALKFLKEWKRMHDSVGGCLDCPLDKLDDIDCGMGAIYAQEKAVEIVEEWSKAHPVKTRMSVFLEAFPKASITSIGIPAACAGNIYGLYANEPCDRDCEECWNEPVEG